MGALKSVGFLLRDAGVKWWNDKAPRLGAALAFYTALSLSPILLIVIFLSGQFFGEDAARGQVVSQLRGMVGAEGAKAIEGMIANAWYESTGVVAVIVGTATLLVGATGVFAELQDALNEIWGVKPKASVGFTGLLLDRLVSFSIICGLAFLLLVSLIINAVMTAVGDYFSGLLPDWTAVVNATNLAVSFLITFALFAMIFKLLPAAKIPWTDVWAGATITTLLFILGKYVIGLYLGRSTVGSTYGAAGSFVVLLLWVYYSTQIVLFGAELAQLYSARYGRGVIPSDTVEPKDADSPACPIRFDDVERLRIPPT